MTVESLLSAVSVGEVFQNPQKGTSTISAITPDYIAYIRGNSEIKLPISAALSAIEAFSGKHCTTSDLRRFLPEVFDSHNPTGRKGHSCNCTFLFCVADKLGLLDGGIQGHGRAGSPYFVVFKEV